MSEVYDVIIAGAGPVGLFLACELRLAKASVLILERDAEPESAWKVLPLGRRGLNTISSEALYRRGLLNDSLDTGERSFQQHHTPGFKYGGNFAGIMLNQEKLDLSRWKYCVPGPTLGPRVTTVDALERVLGERAESLGATRLRGCAFTKILSQNDDEGIVIEAGDEGQTFRGRWLVGCDGGRSAVRKTAGFDFVGTDANFTGYTAKCDFDHPERLKPGFNVTKAGMYVMALGALYLVDYDGATYDRTQEITLEHLQAVFDRVIGNVDVRITAVHLASTFTDRAKQATTYRRGRVLLAGDAAHIHSPLSGQGLTAGLGDAMNLGWKLGMTVRQEQKRDQMGAGRGASLPAIDITVLDTYQDERHPVGVWVTDWTRAQVAALRPDPFGTAVHAMVRDFINTTDGTNVILDQLWGLSQRYDLSEGQPLHSLVGRSAPDFEFADGARLGSKLFEGRGLFVDFEGNSAFRGAVADEHFMDKVDYTPLRVDDRRGLRAFLVRPDGVVAWATDDKDEEDYLDALKAALNKWFAF